MQITSTTEATTSNKRARNGTTVNASRAAASGGSAAHAIDLTSALEPGSRLEPLRPLLESQPVELKGRIISSAQEILTLHATIKQREESVKRFKSTTDANGIVIPFIPNSLRKPCPIKASPATNNDETMRGIVESAAEIYNDCVRKLAVKAKEVAFLEIKLRRKQLRQLYYALFEMLCQAKHIELELLDELPDDEPSLGDADLIKYIVYDVLKSAPPGVISILEMEDADSLLAEYEQSRSFSNATLSTSATADGDDVIKTKIAAVLSTALPILTTDLLNAVEKIDIKHKLNAAIRKKLKPLEMQKANEDVAAALDDDAEMPDADGTAAANTKLADLIAKSVNREVEKSMVTIKRQLQKNSSGAVKNQTQQPGKNGGEQNKNSKRSAKNGNKSKSTQEEDNKGKSSKRKKKQQDDATPKNNSNRTTKQGQAGSAGGSKGGGKRRGAARR